MSDESEKRHRPKFLESQFFTELSKKSFDIHAAMPEISPDTYFAFKHRELERELGGRKLLYLDTNHWINLRHVVLKSPSERPVYRDILRILVKFRREGRICCPISFLMFVELMKQSDPRTRLITAKLMDALSGGLCLQFRLEIGRIELRQFFLKSLVGRKQELRAWVWTKVGFLAGEV